MPVAYTEKLMKPDMLWELYNVLEPFLGSWVLRQTILRRGKRLPSSSSAFSLLDPLIIWRFHSSQYPPLPGISVVALSRPSVRNAVDFLVKDAFMSVHIAQRPAPRAPRFSEIIDSPIKEEVNGCPPTYIELEPLKNDLEQAKKKIRDMALSMPTKTGEVPDRTQTISPQTTEVSTPSEEKVKTPADRGTSQATAGSSKMPEWKRQASLRPKLPNFSSNITGDDLDISFGCLPLRQELKPICNMRKGRKCVHVPKHELDESPIFICLDCNKRPICEACIRNTIENPADPHQADHYLHPWKSTSSLQFDKFLWERRHGARLHFGPKEMLGREWLYSDHSFAPSSTGNLTVRFALNAQPGTYHVSAGVRTYVNPASVSKDKLGKSKYAMIKAGMTWIGSLGLGVQTVDREAPKACKGVNPCLQRLPDKIVEQEVKKGTENVESISLSGTVEVLEGQFVEVSIRHWHDKGIFKKGSPFKWWLDSIT